MVNGVAVGLLGVRYSVIASAKYEWISVAFFLCGMTCYILATWDETNSVMLAAGITTCIAYLMQQYLLFFVCWVWYSVYLKDIICTASTCIVALDCCLARMHVETPLVYMSLMSALFLSERSNNYKKVERV